jgi:phosphoglycerate dehydrogenase-like enzyme
MQTGTVKVAVLDQFEDELYALIEKALPEGWTAARAASYEEDTQVVAATDADVIFAGWAPVTRRIVSASGRLKLIQKLGVGVDRVDLDYCRERGIGVARLAGVNAVPVAEHTVMFMLAALRQLPRSDQRMRAGEWFKEEARGFQRELRGKTVGLIGLGYVGKAVVQRLRGFEVDVLYYDVRRVPNDMEAELGIRYVELDELIPAADVISLHLPLLPSTANLLDDARLRRMKPDAILVNCARGGLIDEGALAAALREGHLAYAALDTFDQEPLTSHDLVRLDNVISTPHCAGATADNFAFVAKRAAENAANYLASRPLPPDDLIVKPE